jgi:hypothetical protein
MTAKICEKSRGRILALHTLKFSNYMILKQLEKEGIFVSESGICKAIKHERKEQ